MTFGENTTNFLTETTLSYASIMGLQKDIGLVGNEYSWLGSVFYFGKLRLTLFRCSLPCSPLSRLPGG